MADALGTTSACAENTDTGAWCVYTMRNYLRVRGEYWFAVWGTIAMWELPPRARRIRNSKLVIDFYPGTTSACAENTHTILDRNPSPWNYLRVRGEYR